VASYEWQSGGTLISGATSSSYTPPVSVVGIVYYYCVVSQSGLNCSVTSATAGITITSAPTFSTQPLASQTVCVDGTVNALTVAYQNGTGTPNYQWYSNTLNPQAIHKGKVKSL
jgi:hypothetical protein